jgi:hypothetical protein
MKQLFFIIITIFLASCQTDDLTFDNTAAAMNGVYQFEKTCMYPTVGKDLTMTNALELTFTPDLKNTNQVLIEELGIYAKITENSLDIPYQTDAAGQFSYAGYGKKDGDDLQLFLNINNHTSNTIETCKMQGQRLEFLD